MPRMPRFTKHFNTCKLSFRGLRGFLQRSFGQKWANNRSVLDSLAKKRAHDDFCRNFFHIREGRGIRCNLC